MRHRKSTLNEANEFLRSLGPARCRRFPDEGKGGFGRGICVGRDGWGFHYGGGWNQRVIHLDLLAWQWLFPHKTKIEFNESTHQLKSPYQQL